VKTGLGKQAPSRRAMHSMHATRAGPNLLAAPVPLIVSPRGSSGRLLQCFLQKHPAWAQA
jgi:hypothetical protein